MDWVLQSSKGRLLAHGDKKKDIQKSVEENEELTESRRRMEGELVNKSIPPPSRKIRVFCNKTISNSIHGTLRLLF